MMARETYRRLDLGSAGLDYVSTRLDAGRSLSKKVAQLVDLDEGVVFTYLPAPLPEVTPQTFRTGGVASVRISEEMVEAVIRRHLAEAKAVLLGENPMANCSDPWVHIQPEGVVCYRDEVYHIGYRDGSGALSIRGALKSARALPGEVSIVTTWIGKPPTSAWPGRLSDVSHLAANATAVVVGAFDGEGYVIWERR
jgi:hypothetical protein